MTLGRSLLLPLALSLGAACTSGGGEEDVGDVSGAVGTYQVTTSYDATGALPDAVGHSLETLTGLHDDPAGTILALLEDAGVPNPVPESFQDDLEGWINEYLASRVYMGVPVTEEI